MTAPSAWSERRLLVPRWRTFAQLLGTGEAAKPLRSSIDFQAVRTEEFKKRLENWRLYPSLLTAAELVESAIVEKREDEVVDAARRILNIENNAAALVRLHSAELLRRLGQGSYLPAETPSLTEVSNRPRVLLKSNPNDAFSWLDLALAQTRRGHRQQAARSIAVAERLSPDNRLVLRSASRFYLHLGDMQRAHDILVRSPATRSDPWLMSAEIAVSRLADRSPRFVNAGLKLLASDNFSDRQISELAGSLATLELDENRKKMKRLFERSVVDPTGNALAQVTWAQPITKLDLVQEHNISHGEYEGSAHFHYTAGMFEKSLRECNNWIEEEPYSARPYEFAAATASVLDEYDTAIGLADRGLAKDTNSASLKLSKLFALASKGDIEGALPLIAELKLKEGKTLLAFVTANEGLVAFRAGNVAEGKRLYADAQKKFRAIGDFEREGIASAYLAREAVLCDDPEAGTLLESSIRLIQKNRFSHVTRHIIGAVVEAAKTKHQMVPATVKAPIDQRTIHWQTPFSSGVIKPPAKKDVT